MKNGLFISLNFALLMFFTLISQADLSACDKTKPHNVKQHIASKCSKTCCKKNLSSSSINCKSACCDKHTAHSKKTKNGCCGEGNCSCSFSTTVSADLPQLYFPYISILLPVLNRKTKFSYKQVFTKSSIQTIWQPPISAHSI